MRGTSRQVPRAWEFEGILVGIWDLRGLSGSVGALGFRNFGLRGFWKFRDLGFRGLRMLWFQGLRAS